MLDGKLSSWSELATSGKFRPFNFDSFNLDPRPSKLFVTRHPSRGIGDLLFMTGPLKWLYERSGGKLEIYWNVQLEKLPAVDGLPFLAHGQVVTGPISYDSLDRFDYHWFVNAVTEYDEEPDQENVYDCLFRQLGVNPENVDARYKRPYFEFLPADDRRFFDLNKMLSHGGGSGLVEGQYVVVSPLAGSVTRSASYSLWIELIQTLVRQGKKVVVVGDVFNQMPSSGGMTFDVFLGYLAKLVETGAVLNLVGSTDVRLTAAILKRAHSLVTLDSGLLFVAQAAGTPAISLWGTHDPRVRIGYSKQLMDLAIWNKEDCTCSPCYAYRGFPTDKCGPRLAEVKNCCLPLATTQVSQIMEKLKLAVRS
jgi:ADP-heptose:LPS heptosyltransferase